jgi:cell division protein FtsA
VSLSHQTLTPRLKPLSSRKSAILSVLDIGTSKVVCIVAELQPVEMLESLRGRTHLARIIGIGHQRSMGLKGGAVVDLDAAESAIRQAVHAAERMAKVEIQSVIVNITGGRIGSEHFEAQIPVRGSVGSGDVHRVLEVASGHSLRPNRAVLHALPTGFSLDDQHHIVDPAGMMGEKLGVDLHVVTTEAAAARNLMLAVERCHLGVEAVIASPTPRPLRLVDDEATWAARRRHGRPAPRASAFRERAIVHTDALAVGGHHVTMDIARGLTTRSRRPSASRRSTARPSPRPRTTAT